MKRASLVLGMVVALVGFMAVGQAQADVVGLSISAGLTSYNVPLGYVGVLNGTSLTLNTGTSGAATFSGSFDGFSAVISTGAVGGSGSLPNLDLSEQTITGTATSPLIVQFSNTGYTFQGGLVFTPSASITGGLTVDASAYYGSTNNPFDTSNQIGTTESFTSPGGLVVTGGVIPATATAPYSLTEQFVITGSGSITSGDELLTPVPEPSTLLLLGFGLFGLGLYGLKRRQEA